ncbi:MAG: hypothetical protein ACM65L_00785 [Microcoleus sp.]
MAQSTLHPPKCRYYTVATVKNYLNLISTEDDSDRVIVLIT